jgi:phosphatidylglycerol:prolipoprotein diacylglycerol transferase
MFEIWGINFYGYGLLIGLGVWAAMEIALKNRGDIDKDTLEKAIWWTVLGGVIGARVYHVVDYWQRYYSTNFIKVFYFWEGGLGIWGAIGGGVLGLFIYSYFNKLKFVKLLDVLVIGMPLAQTVGRVGNFINGELYGKNGEPLFAYEGILNLFLFLVLWRMAKKRPRQGLVSGIYFVGYGVIRIALENLRPTEAIWKFMNIPVAMIMGVLAVLAGGYLIFRRKRS